MPMTEYGDISQRTAAHAAAQMLSHAEPIAVLNKFGMIKPIPKNKAETVKFRRPVPFPVATTPLIEGVTPSSRQMQYEDVPCTLSQYGDYVEITDQVADLSEDPVLKDATMLCGEQAGETLEVITWGILGAGTSVFYAGGVSSRSTVAQPMTHALQRKVTKFIKGQRGKKITSMVNASVNYGTEPVDAAYIAFGHTDLEGDIRDMQGFVPIEKYGSMKALPYEVGKVEDVRYILTPVLAPFTGAGASGKDVYPIITVAKEAYGCVPLKGKEAIKPMVLNPNKPRGGDPLGQRGTVGWKTWFKCVRLNGSWMSRTEVVLSDA